MPAHKNCIPWNKGKKVGQSHKYIPLQEVFDGLHPNLKTISIKQKLLREGYKNWKCEICLNETWNNLPIPLELSHKNGNGADHRLENLELICPNCHAQTPSYKGRNKGNGRHYRRQRYKDNKSY